MITFASLFRPLGLACCCAALSTMCGSNAGAQNLIPNSSFEDVILCPDYFSQLDRTELWFSPTQGSPDYYNVCSPTVYGVPNNLVGSQAAHTGVAYIGIYLWAQFDPEGREYVEVQLNEPLQAGVCYHFAMQVSLADNSQVTTDAIGMAFSDTVIVNVLGFAPLSLVQLVSNQAGVFLSDTAWLEVSGDFTAMGGEEYLLIGNFKDDAGTDTLVTIGSNWVCAYSYVDDVSLVACTPQSLPMITSTIDLINPNPFADQLSVGSNLPGNCLLRVMDARGALVHRSQVSGGMVLNTTSWPAGLYVVDLTLPDGERKRGRFLK